MAVASSASLLVAALLFTALFKHAPEIAANTTTHRNFDFIWSPVICCFDCPIEPASLPQTPLLANVTGTFED